MKTPEKNAERLFEKEFKLVSSSWVKVHQFLWAKERAIETCNEAIDILIDYHKAIKKLRDETEAEALIYEKRIQLWTKTIKILEEKQLS